MASYMALREGWTDKDGNVEPVQFEGAHCVTRFRCKKARRLTERRSQCSTRSRTCATASTMAARQHLCDRFPSLESWKHR